MKLMSRIGSVVAAIAGWELGHWLWPRVDAGLGMVGVCVILAGLCVWWLKIEQLWPFSDQGAWR